MRIVIAPNAFKGSLTAYEAAEAIRQGIVRVLPDAECYLVPIADGGDGTGEVLTRGTGGQTHSTDVIDALGDVIRASFGILGDGTTAVIEMANASGLRLVPASRRNPLVTTTYGTGELMRAALNAGAQKIIVGLGGSATVDGGAGMAQALGARLFDAQGQELTWGGGALHDLDRIDISAMDARLQTCEIVAACDVDYLLLGKQGSAHIFGPQKGATPEMVLQLDENLAHYARIIQRDLGINVIDVPGSGAAGGLAAGLIAFCGARLQSGSELVLDTLNIDDHLQTADLVITGEGRLDGQTGHGKGPIVVAQRAKRYGVPVVALAGALGEDADQLYAHGIDVIMPIVSRPMPLEKALQEAEDLLREAAARMMRLIYLM